MNIRQAASQDAGLVSRIIAASWRGAYQDLIDPSALARLPEDYWLPSMRTWLDSGRMYGLIAEEDGCPVGCMIYGRGRDAAFADWGEIVSLYTLPECMRRGVGGALLNEALRLLREDGHERVYLWAIEGNAIADAFYRKHGFRCTQDRVPYRIGGADVADLRYTLG